MVFTWNCSWLCALFIEKFNATNVLTYAGVRIRIYLSYKITFSLVQKTPTSSETWNKCRYDFANCNGKAFIHLLILMTVFGTAFGTGFIGKMIIALLNVNQAYRLDCMGLIWYCIESTI